MSNRRSLIFKSLLNALWLRPESALWYAHMLSAAHSFGAGSLSAPSLEFGCMDGVNSFVILGGDVPFKFDVFSETSWDRTSHTRSSLRDDYYDKVSQETADTWCIGPPPRQFTYGVDWKESHIQKAARLQAHGDLVLWTPGTPLSTFDDASISGIWAPNIYWMDDLGLVLSEFKRVLKSGGQIVTIGPDAALVDHMLYRHGARFDGNWIADLDRGRHVNAQRNGRTFDEWKFLFEKSRLGVVRHEGFLPSEVNDLYEVGFRPMFAPLLQMREGLQVAGDGALHSVKKIWIERIVMLLGPFLDNETLYNFKGPLLWHIFELTHLE